MKWLEIKIQTTEEASEAVSEMLNSIGAGGVVIEDPYDIRRQIEDPNSLDYADDQFLNSLGEDVIIKAYFSEEKEREALFLLIQEKLRFISQFLDIGKGFTDSKEVDDEDWATAWKKYYQPFLISKSVVIKPTWEEYESQPGEIIIELDPGMAFGTGTHETTAMCSSLLEKYLKQGDAVMDAGCGSGILSIIAAKLGAKSVQSFDVDEVAVRVTKENCSLNHVNHIVHAFKGVLSEVPKQKIDLAVANIIANVIVDISSIIPYYLRAGGIFITSGIIKERKEEILNVYSDIGFSCIEVIERGEWVAIVLKCPDSL